MTDIATIIGLVSSATSSILGATEAGKNLNEIFRRPEVDVTASKQLVIELLDKLIDAKAAQAEIRDLVLTLQRELQERDQFEAELARYALTKTDRGARIYTLKADDSRGEPLHHICPSCVGQRKKSILQPSVDAYNSLTCPSCKTRFLADTSERGDLTFGFAD
ncbi:hypothetical protein ACTTAK_06645 [Rhodobacter capsulatus]|uniref:hypothetical protein n=1 Tax=Rhodobacter capsulatus TaxID=1061 RepID=UPI0011432804|nr:hypothetical protein [Rhodobacter capsulatus]QXH25101.1 hypothetical protein RCWATERBOI_10 [Rhodobacter phage RcWaterboi]TQD37441.1 hypothetical protein FKW81_02350 [Rhodobacter capsulatus]